MAPTDTQKGCHGGSTSPPSLGVAISKGGAGAAPIRVSCSWMAAAAFNSSSDWARRAAWEAMNASRHAEVSDSCPRRHSRYRRAISASHPLARSKWRTMRGGRHTSPPLTTRVGSKGTRLISLTLDMTTIAFTCGPDFSQCYDLHAQFAARSGALTLTAGDDVE